MIRDYIFTSTAILRTPAYSFEEYRGMEGAKDLVSDTYFQAAIKFASHSLFRELQQADFDFHRLGEKARTTLHKYYNRMCYRPTPFGIFSGIAQVAWGTESILVRGGHYHIHAFSDFGAVIKEAEDIKQDRPTITYQANPSLYFLSESYRYLRYEYKPDGKRVFFLQEMERSAPMDNLLQFLAAPQTESSTVNYLMTVGGICELDARLFFFQLAAEQLLLPSSLPTPISINRSLPLSLHEIMDAACSTTENEHQLYVNLENTVISGHINNAYKAEILDALSVIDRLVPQQEPAGLADFVNKFEKRYERRMVPLMEALDPEIGIGYQGLAYDDGIAVFLQNIPLELRTSNARPLNWSDAHIMLLEQWDKMRLHGSMILQLSDEQLNHPPAANVAYPPSMAVLFRFANEGLYIEQAGGATATALSGRFSLFHDGIRNELRQLATIEQNSNPEVVFAEISHISHAHTSNIDRRKHIRDYEITVLTGPALEKERQISINELSVTVDNGHIILWSERLQKIVVPRLSSAFNYMRDDLPLFRFLCDLQYQGLKTGFHFDLQDFFPGLNCYPRVQYRNTILQLARWRIDGDKLNQLSLNKNAAEQVKLLTAWCREWKWPQYISLDDHDNQLVFDTGSESSLLFLAQNLKGLTSAMIREFPFCNRSVTIDEKEQPYIQQFVVSLYHTDAVYRQCKNYQAIKTASGITRKFSTGSNWLYYKLYCHPSRSNEILTTRIMPLLGSLLSGKAISRWFFIRYRDPGYHLRIRLQVDSGHIGQVIDALHTAFSKDMTSGMIHDIQLHTYERELERYSRYLIEDMEQLFHYNSELILDYLDNCTEQGNRDKNHFIFSSIQDIINVFGLADHSRVALFEKLYTSLYQSFKNNKATNEALKRKFRELRTTFETYSIHTGMPDKPAVFISKCAQISKKINDWAPTMQMELIADIIHMHLNRLLSDEQRKQEMVIYYCLYKYYHSAQQRCVRGGALSAGISG